jgi:hypothetical protein
MARRGFIFVAQQLSPVLLAGRHYYWLNWLSGQSLTADWPIPDPLLEPMPHLAWIIDIESFPLPLSCSVRIRHTRRFYEYAYHIALHLFTCL